MKQRPPSGREILQDLRKDPAMARLLEPSDPGLRAFVRELRSEAAPLLEDLASVGIRVESVWDLVNSANTYDAAFPILVDHLRRPYHPRTKDGIARALTVSRARDIAFDPLLAEFLACDEPWEGCEPRRKGYKYALGNALATLMDAGRLGVVIGLVRDRRHGKHRGVLVRGLSRYYRREVVREAMEGLVEDPDIGEAARKVLAKGLRTRA